MSSPTCPRCATATLLRAESGGHVLLACSQCAGVWLDEVHAAPLLAPLTDLHDRPAAYAPLPCPRCGVLMPAQFSPMANLEVDRCRAHGAWFDRDEVAHVAHAIAWLRGEPPPVLPAPYVQAQPHDPHFGTAVAGAAVGVAAVAFETTQRPRSSKSASEATCGHYDAAEAVVVVPDLADAAIHGVAKTADVVGDAAHALSGVGHAGDAVDAVSGAGDAADALSGVGDAIEAGSGVLEGAGELLGSLLEGLGGIFEGL